MPNSRAHPKTSPQRAVAQLERKRQKRVAKTGWHPVSSLAAGFVRYPTKPINVVEFMHAIDDVLKASTS